MPLMSQLWEDNTRRFRGMIWLLISNCSLSRNCLLVSTPVSYCLRLRVVYDEIEETPGALNIG